MSAPVLRYLLVWEHNTEGRIVSEDVERYTKEEFEKSFEPEERATLNAGKALCRDSRVKPGTYFAYFDMTIATRRWHSDPSEQMVRAGVDEALHGPGVGGGRRWPDYISELWCKMRDAAS